MLCGRRRSCVRAPVALLRGRMPVLPVRVTCGVVPSAPRRGGRIAFAQNFVLACQAVPSSDLEVSVDAARHLEVPARLQSLAGLWKTCFASSSALGARSITARVNSSSSFERTVWRAHHAVGERNQHFPSRCKGSTAVLKAVRECERQSLSHRR